MPEDKMDDTMENIIYKEKLVREYIEQGDKEAAIKLLFELAVHYARDKNFEAAEAMRSRILDIDPMALSAIVNSGDIIEEEKYKAIDRGHREIWAKLYQDLGVVEANTLYFALKKATFQTEETISRQGELKPRIYFINSGRIKVVYFKDGEEVFLKHVEPGQLAGEDAFFYPTFCTTSMIALCRTELSYLDSDILKVWATTSPMLESKLNDFATKSPNILDLLKAKAIDRRRLKRIPFSGKATVHLMNSSDDQVGKPFKVNMGNISRGGTCFYVRIPKRETANLLLGKRLRINYTPPQMGASHLIRQSGTIVALRFHPLDDCTVCVKFDSLLPEALIEQLEKMSQPPQDFDY